MKIIYNAITNQDLHLEKGENGDLALPMFCFNSVCIGILCKTSPRKFICVIYANGLISPVYFVSYFIYKSLYYVKALNITDMFFYF